MRRLKRKARVMGAIMLLLMSMAFVTSMPMARTSGTIYNGADDSIGVPIAPVEGKDDFVTQSSVDWWPMFHHDLTHTGYSTSTAPSTNQTLWTYTTNNNVYSSPAVAYGKVYVGSGDHNVYCLDASTGAFVWSYTTGARVFSSPAVVDGKVYVGSDDFKVYCLNATTGTHIWNYTTGNVVGSSPAVSDGKVYVGSYDRNVYCLDALTGTQIWNYTTYNDVDSSPAVSDGRVYVGSMDSRVYCLDATNGTRIWERLVSNNVGSSPAVSDGKVYVGSYDRNVYCLDALTGTQIWNYTTGAPVVSSPAVAYGKVYVGSNDHRVYSLDATNGTQIWNYTTGHYVSSPAVADGKVYVGSDDFKVYCVSASTGESIWNYTTGSFVISNPAVAYGKVYVGSYDRKIYAFGAPPVHNVDTGLYYWSIQEAIDADETSDGHTLVCDSWNYTEFVDVYKSLNITGNGSESTWIIPPSPLSTMRIRHGAVNITGFSIVTSSGCFAVSIEGSSYCNLWNCTIVGSGSGVDIRTSDWSIVSNCTVDCRGDGMFIRDWSLCNRVVENEFLNNNYGIIIRNASNYNIIERNLVNSSALDGIRLNLLGAGFLQVENNTIHDNVVSNSSKGIVLDGPSAYNLVTSNLVIGNRQHGINAKQSTNNTIAGNVVKENAGYGIYCESSNYNLIYDNFLRNSNNAWDNGANTWNNSDPSLKGYWGFNEGSGTTTHDISGYGNHGTINGATWIAGKYAQALGFDGLNDYVDTPHSSSLNVTGDISIEVWLKADVVQPGSIVEKSAGSPPYPYVVREDNNGNVYFAVSDVTQTGKVSGAYIGDGVWHHLVFTKRWAGGVTVEMKAYADGALVNTTYCNITGSVSNAVHVYIGSSGGVSSFFKGTIDEVRIFGRVLSADEVAKQFKTGAYRSIVGGPLMAGNYWSDNPSSVDSNDDGIGDVPYTLLGGTNKDFLPLVIQSWPHVKECENLNILYDGTASVDMWLNVSESDMASMYRRMLGSEEVDQTKPIPEFRKVPYTVSFGENVTIESPFAASEIWLPARDELVRSIVEEKNNTLGIGLDITNSSMRDDSAAKEFKVWMNGYALLQVVNVSFIQGIGKYRWEIVVGSVDENASAIAAACLMLKISFLEDMLASRNGYQEFEGSHVTKINLPAGATLLDPQNLDGLNWTVDFGGGTRVTAMAHLEGASTIVLNETLTVTLQPMTLSVEDFFSSYIGNSFKTLRINITMPVQPSGIPTYKQLDWEEKWEKDWSQTIWTTEISKTWGNQSLGANLTITPTISQSGYIGLGMSGKKWHPWPNYYWLKAWMSFTIDVNIEAEAWATASFSHYWEEEIFPAITWPGIIQATCLGVPLWADLKLAATAYTNITAQGNVTVRYTSAYSRTLKAGIQWDSDHGWEKIWDGITGSQSSDGPSVDVYADVSVKAGVKARLELLLYSVEGPYAELELYGKLDVIWNFSCTSQWAIEVGLVARCGFVIDIDFKIVKKFTFYKEWEWGEWNLLKWSENGSTPCHSHKSPKAKFHCHPWLPVSCESITFDGSDSVAFDNCNITNYEWTIKENKTGSTILHQSGPSCKTITCAFNMGGWYKVNLTVTDNYEINNTNSWIRTIYVLGKDESIIAVSVSINYSYQNLSPLGIEVTVQNSGDVTQENISIALYLTPVNSTLVYNVANLTVESLPPGMRTTLKWIGPIDAPLGLYHFCAYTPPVLCEMNTTDNMYTGGIVDIRIVGDVNGDGKVDVKDVYVVARDYGTSPEGPNPPGRTYHPNNDINRDGKIDIKDYYVVCKHYGETYP